MARARRPRRAVARIWVVPECVDERTRPSARAVGGRRARLRNAAGACADAVESSTHAVVLARAGRRSTARAATRTSAGVAAPVRRRVRLVPDDDRPRVRYTREHGAARSRRSAVCACGAPAACRRAKPKTASTTAVWRAASLGASELAPRSTVRRLRLARATAAPDAHRVRAEPPAAAATTDERDRRPLERVVVDPDDQPPRRRRENESATTVDAARATAARTTARADQPSRS